MRTRDSRRSATQKKAEEPPVSAGPSPKPTKRELVDDAPAPTNDNEDDDEFKVEMDVMPRKKRARVNPPAPAATGKASTSAAPSAAGPGPGRGCPRKVAATGRPGRPRKVASKVKPQEDLSVEVVQDAEHVPTIAELEDRAIYKSYNKLKVGTDGSKPGFTPEEMTFAVGDTCVLRRPDSIPQACDEWICRIERIRAQDANSVYCVIRWFYTPTQATVDLHLPKSYCEGMGPDEIFASDHLEVIDVLTVDAHVKVNFGPTLLGGSEYNYTRKVILGTANKKASAVPMKAQLLPPDSTAKVTLL